MTKIISRIDAKRPDPLKPKRVAAYARVSTDTERLMHSLSAQVSYYSDLIQRTPGWVYAGVYADEGITGAKLSARDEFQRMMDDCEAGKIDIILTKSLSRFARNTVDTLSTVRRLRELGIEVRFEKENITSLDEGGELMITLYASFAQEEIRSLSDNVKWGTRRRFEKGIPNGHFRIMGYRWEGDQLVIHPEEAAVVRRIFQNFLDGKSRLETERELRADGIKTPLGHWYQDSSIKAVLTNITYTGNMLLQKEYIEDPISKKRRKNHGELTQYFIEDTHEAIIDRETFDFVQAEIARRKELGPRANKSLRLTCFSGIIKCSCHGYSFMRSKRKNRAMNPLPGDENVVYWQCGATRVKGGSCEARPIPAKVLDMACAEALGLPAFDEATFTERVAGIVISGKRHMLFTFRDGSTWETDWVSTAKKDAWTAERRAECSALRSSPVDNPYSHFTFSHRITCGFCGRHYGRQRNKLVDGEYAYFWGAHHTGKECCPQIRLEEDTLCAITAKVLGLDYFDEAVFKKRVHHITHQPDGTLEFTLLDGTVLTGHYDRKRRGRPCSQAQKEYMSKIMKKVWEERHGKQYQGLSANKEATGGLNFLSRIILDSINSGSVTSPAVRSFFRMERLIR